MAKEYSWVVMLRWNIVIVLSFEVAWASSLNMIARVAAYKLQKFYNNQEEFRAKYSLEYL